ncbi:MAG TPA: elongation factor P maturation arginine rhamnosyltransferase EarP [Limnobacter sp.]|nr:elongation factor P maturation arginine rhamnosyltransferase EarP [Limnobacter sp.]
MQVLIICKVIDNFGDAGVCLRLARAITKQGHSVTLLHNDTAAFSKLLERHPPGHLTLLHALDETYSPEHLPVPELIVEPFGTSSEQLEHRYEVPLKVRFPDCPWVLLDYLSAEAWVADFHKGQSVDPRSGHRVTYFYPGFGDRTGGVIHCDAPTVGCDVMPWIKNPLKLFVFCYANAPVTALMAASKASGDEVGFAGACGRRFELPHHWLELPFCPQIEFDDRLAAHDVLFVRGEDSFVRAQLAGKPFVWQIYPTDDGAHGLKLRAFFDRYSADWGTSERETLWRLWQLWNGLIEQDDFVSAWLELRPHLPTLHRHAMRWRETLLKGPDLVKELLTWRDQQSPTFGK